MTVQRFVAFAGTISIANGSSTVTGTGTAFGGRDREGAQVWAQPTGAAPYRIGTVAAIDPRYPVGQYDNLSLPLLDPWNGTSVVNQPYELLDGLAIAIGTTQAAIYARFAAQLEQNAGLVLNSADSVDKSLVPNNSLFIDAVSRVIYQWRSGVLEPVYTVATVFNPRGAYDGTATYAQNDLVSIGGAAFVSNINGNTGNTPTTSPAPASDANWTVLFLGSGADYADYLLSAPGVVGNSEKLFVVAIARTVVFPAGVSGSEAVVGTAPTADAVFSLQKNGVQFGTVTFAASATAGTFSVASDTTFAPGDVLSVIGPATADATLADVSITLRGTTDVASSPTRSGTAVINFGSMPGAYDASAVITGQGKVTANSLIQAWVLPGAGTTDHTADEHLLAGLRLTIDTIVPGTGFTIRAYSPDGAAYGQYNIAWRWI